MLQFALQSPSLYGVLSWALLSVLQSPSFLAFSLYSHGVTSPVLGWSFLWGHQYIYEQCFLTCDLGSRKGLLGSTRRCIINANIVKTS